MINTLTVLLYFAWFEVKIQSFRINLSRYRDPKGMFIVHKANNEAKKMSQVTFKVL